MRLAFEMKEEISGSCTNDITLERDALLYREAPRLADAISGMTDSFLIHLHEDRSVNQTQSKHHLFGVMFFLSKSQAIEQIVNLILACHNAGF